MKMLMSMSIIFIIRPRADTKEQDSLRNPSNMRLLVAEIISTDIYGLTHHIHTIQRVETHRPYMDMLKAVACLVMVDFGGKQKRTQKEMYRKHLANILDN